MTLQPRRILLALLLLLLFLAAGLALTFLFIPGDTDEIHYPQTLAEVYVVPEVSRESRENFEGMFVGTDAAWNELFHELSQVLPSHTAAFDGEARAQVSRAREIFAPAEAVFRRLAANPPYPQYFPTLAAVGETYERIRLITILHFLEARLLLDVGEDPLPALEPALVFLENYHEGAGGLVDVYLVQSAYSVLLDLFPEESVRRSEPVRRRLEHWRETWREQFIRGIKLEFLFFQQEVSRVDGSVARHLVDQEFFSLRKLRHLILGDRIFQKNHTLNAYWEHLKLVQQAVRENTPENWNQARDQLGSILHDSPWYNQVGAYLVQVGTPDFHSQFERLSTLEYRINAIF